MKGGDQEQRKHACRVCRRSFPCGRSLGGHMRSHNSANSPSKVPEEKPPPPPQQRQERSPPTPSESSTGPWGPGDGYGLRENPKKTWRVCESIEVGVGTKQAQLCRQCGKGFPSWGALFGHMRCHSARQKEKGRPQETGEQRGEEEEEEEGSWDSGTMGVALCLMMLSRDVGLTEPSDENSSLLEEMERIAESGKSSGTHRGDRRLGKNSPSKKRKVSILDAEVWTSHGKVRHGSPAGASHRKNKFECRACGKAFHSYQALGGHRAGHKRRHFAISAGDGGFRGAHHQQRVLPPPPGALDLNLPAAADEDSAWRV